MLHQVLRRQLKHLVSKISLQTEKFIFLQARPLSCQKVIHEIHEGALTCSVFAYENQLVILKPYVHRFGAVQAGHLESSKWGTHGLVRNLIGGKGWRELIDSIIAPYADHEQSRYSDLSWVHAGRGPRCV